MKPGKEKGQVKDITHQGDAKGKPGEGVTELRIPPPNLSVVEVPIHNKGLPSMIVNSMRNKPPGLWDKGIAELEGRTKTQEKRNPKKEYQESLYRMPGKKTKYAIVASGMKKALVRAANRVKGLAMTEVTESLWVLADADDLIGITGKPSMHEDIVRIGKFPNKTPQMRFRGEFKNWSTTLRIRFDADCLSAEEVVNLVARAGRSIGWGEKRLEKGYDHGGWLVKGEAKVTKCAA